MKAVILAGGLGTRLREETEFKPKPMVEIGGLPILWHIMKILYTQGIDEFIICLGYKGEVIRDFFLNYHNRIHDIQIDYTDSMVPKIISRNRETENWRVSLIDTGLMTPTAGRLHNVKHLLEDGPFLCTYGDGLADIKLGNLISFHSNHAGIATVTAVNPPSRFGAVDLNNDNRVTTFEEKPGFELIEESSSLEQEVLPLLARSNELWAYKHEGFWRPMDTIRETKELNEIFVSGNAPWKTW
jgi:glucose-1-phosphate cytidylyltransferase